MARIDALTNEQRERFYKALETRNGLVVECNQVITASLGCNTNVSILGSDAQAKAIMAYLLKYMTKTPSELSHAITVIHNVRQTIANFPSVAEDTGTERRTAMHFFTRMVNKLSNAVEVSTATACLLLLGMPAEICSHGFQMLFANAALAFILKKGQHSEEPDDFDDLSEYIQINLSSVSFNIYIYIFMF